MRKAQRHRSYLRQVARTLEIPDVLHLTAAAQAAERKAEQARRRAAWKGPESELLDRPHVDRVDPPQ